MHENDIIMLKGNEILSILAGQEAALIDVVRKAYKTHGKGNSSLPHSLFLRFPDNAGNRIIALPTYLGGDFDVAGIKWVSSFPGNLELGLDRASAVILLNSASTGRLEAILEGSVISAKRTAASAALAAQCLQSDSKPTLAGIIGCGLINFEICRFLLAVIPDIRTLIIYDKEEARAELFKAKLLDSFPGVLAEVAKNIETVLGNSSLVSIATTAISPHIFDLSACQSGSTILHISLRDLSPEVILSCGNVVDDIDHVCRAQTSVHLAEQLIGNRDFIGSTLADLLNGSDRLDNSSDRISVFSPFGLGVLDISVSKFVLDLALQKGMGTVIISFIPDPWINRP